jgi:hypothetical protein
MVMGKYSQWLYHREIDQQLRERLEFIERDLHTQQEQAALLEDAASCTDNSILQAIAMQQSAAVLLEDTLSPSSTPQHPLDAKEESSKSVSSALFAWSNLPNLDTRNMQMPGISSNGQTSEGVRQTSVSHPEAHLLPDDLTAFIDATDQTQPQLQIPRWLRKAQLTTNTPGRTQSEPDERTNTSIQRWLERWGKQVPNPPLEQQKPRESSEK